MELESAVERLYTDESLSADVDDATAQPLLKWAEAQLPAIIENFGDEGFEDAFITFKKLIKSVGRLIGERKGADDFDRQDRIEKIQRFAGKLNIQVDTAAITADIAAQSGPAVLAQIVGAPPLEAFSAPIGIPTSEDDYFAQNPPVTGVPEDAVAQAAVPPPAPRFPMTSGIPDDTATQETASTETDAVHDAPPESTEKAAPVAPPRFPMTSGIPDDTATRETASTETDAVHDTTPESTEKAAPVAPPRFPMTSGIPDDATTQETASTETDAVHDAPPESAEKAAPVTPPRFPMTSGVPDDTATQETAATETDAVHDATPESTEKAAPDGIQSLFQRMMDALRPTPPEDDNSPKE